MNTVTVSTMKALNKAMSTPEVEAILVKSGQDMLGRVLKMNSAGQLVGGVPSSLMRLAIEKPQILKDARWPVVAVVGIAAAALIASVVMLTRSKITVKWNVLKVTEGEIVLARDMTGNLEPPKLALDSP